MTVPRLRLIDCTPATPVSRAETVRKMADHLVQFDSFRTESDAIRSLLGRYPSFEIAALVDDARQVAVQETVAAEMSRQ